MALILLPIVEGWTKAEIARQFGLLIDASGMVSRNDGGDVPQLTQTFASLVATLLLILRVLLGMALVITVVRFLILLITKTVYRNAEQGEISSLLKTVLSIIVYIVAFFIIFQSQFPGVQLTALFTGSTIIGIVVGLALQDTLGNLFAGLALQADAPFQVGDVLIIPGRGEGVVEGVSWRGVTIRTFQNKLLVVSNSVLGKEILEVAPKDNLNAKLVFFNTEYENSPARTIHLIREAVRSVDNVSDKIRPVVRIRSLAADGIDWEIKYWLDDYRQQYDTDALIRQRIWYAFKREKIEFAFPARTIHFQPQSAASSTEEQEKSFAARLGNVSIFAPLSETEIQQLSATSSSRTYAPGETIVRRGDAGGSMFVVAQGSVEVKIAGSGSNKTISSLQQNDFFGEMSLLTGEPRSADVVAAEETEVLRIDKAGLQAILESNPALVESICDLIDQRKALIERLDAENLAQNPLQDTKGVMRSIKAFFGLK